MDRLQLQPSRPTVYVQADLSNFKELVQGLTGQPQPATVASAATAQADTAPAAITVAAAAPAARRGSITVRRMSAAVQNKLEFKPKLTVASLARARLAAVASPSPSPSPAAAISPAAPWGPEGPCVLNRQVELPPSPPSASTLAEEVGDAAFAAAAAAEENTKQKRILEMYQSPAPATVWTRPVPKLLNLFPLTSSYSKED